MFTARSEYRLTLRAENADRRLSQRAMDLGLLEEGQIEAYRKKVELMDKAVATLHSFSLPNNQWFAKGIERASPTKTEHVSAYRVIGYPNAKVQDVQRIWKESELDLTIDKRIEEHLNVECQYDHYSR